MTLGLKSILVLAAVVLFLVAIFVDENALKWLAAGLAAFAASFFVGDSPGLFGGRRRRL